jgi:hypothetical protein
MTANKTGSGRVSGIVKPARQRRKKTKAAAEGAKKTPSQRGRTFSAAHRAKLSAALKGRVVTAATRAKLSAALRGRKQSEATKAKLRRILRSEAVRAKMSAAHKGKRLSAAHRAALSAARLGKPLSAAHRAAISTGQKGRVVTAATRAKMSAALRGPRGPNYRHGLYAIPTYPIRTEADLIRALSEVQARLSDLMDEPANEGLADQARLHELYRYTGNKLVRLLRDQWRAQADAAAVQALLDDTMKILDEMEKEEGKEK